MVAVQDERAKHIEAIKNFAAVIARSEDVTAIIHCIDRIKELGERLAALEDDLPEETDSTNSL